MPNIILRCLLQIAAVAVWEVFSVIYLISRLSTIRTSMSQAGLSDMDQIMGLPSSADLTFWLFLTLITSAGIIWAVIQRFNWAPWLIVLPLIVMIFGLASNPSFFGVAEIGLLGNAMYELLTDSDATEWLNRTSINQAE